MSWLTRFRVGNEVAILKGPAGELLPFILHRQVLSLSRVRRGIVCEIRRAWCFSTELWVLELRLHHSVVEVKWPMWFPRPCMETEQKFEIFRPRRAVLVMPPFGGDVQNHTYQAIS